MTRTRDFSVPVLDGLDDAEAVVMDEETFRAFYDRTARPLWAYLARMSGDAQLADDLLQEAYYRFLRAGQACDNDVHRRNYLYRIATNLLRDQHRRRRVDCVPFDEDAESRTGAAQDPDQGRAADVAGALTRLKPRERDLLWLAYAQGSTHAQIADALGLKTASVRQLLFRARKRLASLLEAYTDPARRRS